MRYVLFAVVAPFAITIGWGWVLFMCLIQAAEALEWETTLVLTAEWKPWVVKRWPYATTICRGIIYQPGERWPGKQTSWTAIQNHEHVHVRQVEDQMFISLIIGILVAVVTHNWILGLVIWFSGGMWQILYYLPSGMRGGRLYMDAEHERAAYAQTDLDSSGKSWLDKSVKTDLT